MISIQDMINFLDDCCVEANLAVRLVCDMEIKDDLIKKIEYFREIRQVLIDLTNKPN